MKGQEIFFRRRFPVNNQTTRQPKNNFWLDNFFRWNFPKNFWSRQSTFSTLDLELKKLRFSARDFFNIEKSQFFMSLQI